MNKSSIPDAESLAFSRAFDRGEIDALDHEGHVRLAWTQLQCGPLSEAFLRLPPRLRRFAAQKGRPEVFHETITGAFLVLINEAVQRTLELDWDEFKARHADVFRPDFLHRYYRKETLDSALARRVFLWPDRIAEGASHRR